MKVYQISAPQKLAARSEDQQFLEDANLSGRPFPGDWKRIELLIEGETGPVVDFYGFGSRTDERTGRRQ